MDTVTIPAYAADTLEESLTLCAPKEWHDRIKALSPKVCYGPDFDRAILFNLKEMSGGVKAEYTAAAYDYLLNAEKLAGITFNEFSHEYPKHAETGTEFEAMTSFEDGTIIYISKVGGGTVGTKYAGNWHYRVELPKPPYSAFDQSIKKGSDFHTGTEMTHYEAAIELREFFEDN